MLWAWASAPAEKRPITVGRATAATNTMMAITTSNSVRVKPFRIADFLAGFRIWDFLAGFRIWDFLAGFRIAWSGAVVAVFATTIDGGVVAQKRGCKSRNHGTRLDNHGTRHVGACSSAGMGLRADPWHPSLKRRILFTFLMAWPILVSISCSICQNECCLHYIRCHCCLDSSRRKHQLCDSNKYQARTGRPARRK